MGGAQLQVGSMVKTISRREVLSSAAALAAASTSSVRAQTPAALAWQAALGEGKPFDAGQLVETARVLARRPMLPPALNDLPDGYGTMGADTFSGIRAVPEAVLWTGENRGFTVEPLHRGHVFTSPVQLFVVEEGQVRRIAYDRTRFDFGRTPPPPGNVDLGFSGFRVATGLERPFDVAMFQGATFFRSMARGQNFGAMARGLILRPGETRGEETPYFRAFWIERPTAASGVLVIHALLDSDSLTGAVRMTLRPGDVTLIDVEMTLFARRDIDHIGYGCISGTFLAAPQNRRTFDDVRPAVHEISGAQMLTGAGEWIYRPANNPATLQVSGFMDSNPKGFGLVQRDRDYASFQDDEQRFELRPSVWNEPLGDWGAGAVQLIEIPSESEVNDNVIAYWRPRAPLPAGSETSVAFRQSWCWLPPERPPLAITSRVRQGRGSQGRRRRYFVDFTGDALADTSIVTSAKPILSATPGAIHNLRLWPYPERKTMRVSFEMDPGNENVSELRLVLDSGGQPISETWLNRWTS